MSTALPPPHQSTIEELDAEIERWVRPGQELRWFFRRFTGNPSLVAGVAILAFYLAAAIAALVYFGSGLTTPPVRVDWAEQFPPPGPQTAHPFGVMSGIGVDVLDELARAVPIDLAIVSVALASAMTVGVLLGAYAGVRGGAFDFWVTFAADVGAGMPPFFFVVVLYAGVELFVPPGVRLEVFPLFFGAVLWPYYARPVRVVSKQLVGEPFVESARAAGATRPHLLFRHVIPNALYPALAQVPVDLYNVFFVLTIFPYLACYSPTVYGLLSPLPNPFFPEWGSMLAQGTCYGFSIAAPPGYWWMYLFPAATILSFGFGVTLVCDGVERLLSTRRRT
ncbi:MAG: ABC transporter permease subunit [Thermoplasmata archaeon]|nr:ABC transporter permease subunit [Thermoplasmata archaeon]MCI4332266.1 ABC transporter permease subunit [Thermoplasmata archaeon]